ncbi:MAG TPA: hypothetical protein VIK01_26120, partial [Polyangiaceae bacterium]
MSLGLLGAVPLLVTLSACTIIVRSGPNAPANGYYEPAPAPVAAAPAPAYYPPAPRPVHQAATPSYIPAPVRAQP